MQLLQAMLAPSMLLVAVHPVPGNTTVVANQIPVHMNYAWPALTNTDQTALVGIPTERLAFLMWSWRRRREMSLQFLIRYLRRGSASIVFLIRFHGAASVSVGLLSFCRNVSLQ